MRKASRLKLGGISNPKQPPSPPQFGFTPASLFAAGEVGCWFDFTDLSTLFQDTAGTIPVTAVGQSVARANDKSGLGNNAVQANALLQPILRLDPNGIYCLQFDGVDDNLVTPNINFGVTNKVTLFVGMRQLANTTNQTPISTGPSDPAGSGGSFFLRSSSNRALFARALTSTAAGNVSTATIPLTASILTASIDVAAPSLQIRANGAVAAANAANLGSGNFVSRNITLGRRGDGIQPYVGYMYGAIVRGAASTAAEVGNTEAYLNVSAKAF